MILRLLVLLFIINCSFSYAQTVKTDVLVMGDNASGTAAAIQCARSKVKTLLAGNGFFIDAKKPSAAENIIINAARMLPSGIWGEFRTRLRQYYKGRLGHDTAFNAPVSFEANVANEVLKRITDTVKNLSVYSKTVFLNISKDGTGWDVKLTRDGHAITIKAKVVIDATPNGIVVTKAGVNNLPEQNKGNDNLLPLVYRTSIAADEPNSGSGIDKPGSYPSPAYCLPVSALIIKNADNLLITERALPLNTHHLPYQLAVGQGAGTVAAYCAFFKTTTKNLNIRLIQGELLDFKGYLLPFADVTPLDRDWRAIQQVGATGLLKGSFKNTSEHPQLNFSPDSAVRTEEIRPVLNEIYTRAFLWFNKEKPGQRFTVGNLVSLLSDLTLTDPQTLKNVLQKAWKAQYKFPLTFDPDRAVTRREFAALTNKYINPFARKVDMAGNLVN